MSNVTITIPVLAATNLANFLDDIIDDGGRDETTDEAYRQTRDAIHAALGTKPEPVTRVDPLAGPTLG